MINSSASEEDGTKVNNPHSRQPPVREYTSCIEVVYIAVSDAYHEDPSVVDETLSILASTDKLRRGYAGLDVSATYFCILHEWDTLADHISSTQDTPKYTSLLSSVHRFVKLPPLHRDHRDHDHYNHDHDHPLDNSSESPDTNTNSSSPIEMFHVDFSHDPRPAFTAGITEVTSWSWTPNLDVVAEAPSLKPSVHRLLTLLNGRRTGTAVYGTCVEDAERLVVACGWDTLEARSQALQESQSLRETLSHLRAVATETVHLVTLRPFK